MTTDISHREFVFVGGLHRSGTTLLASAIGSSPSFSGLVNTGVRMDEGQFLQDIYPTGAEMGGVTRWAFDPRAHMTETDPQATPQTAEKIFGDWMPYWDLSATYLVEKTPLNLTKTRFLQRLFPQSSFIIITRHPITQALTVQKWAATYGRKLGFHFPEIVAHWVRAHDLFFEDASHLRRVLVVRYEDLIRNPSSEMSRVGAFLGADVDRTNITADSARSRVYEDQWDSYLSVQGWNRMRPLSRLPRSIASRKKLVKIGSDMVGNWKFADYARDIAERFGEPIRRFGYDVEDLGRAIPAS